ncbi:beta-ketoacyl synthase N-terminal-like domain-containing protein [Chondrinema litorale]|uniref:beta-ketoacyl synthase N-terminal-like domain-containing protein n=1 Tax=Chondrinema litorale TaxID=2994555 RepID=UPI0025433629|nr:beta-ketoacyl synthase N-terminal-like domain-containing protein [Chondrinema litorale]UZR96685.1 beta-ketoacyl synthase N-terminal-like domain-containing protein [Chondrinema litorale]
MENQQRIVITGVGTVSSMGVGKASFIDKITQNLSGISLREKWEYQEIEKQYCGVCTEFSIKNYLAGLRFPFPLRYSQLAMLGCHLAIDDAQLDLPSFSPERLGLILNTDIAANAAVESYLTKLYERGADKVSPLNFTKTVANCALGDVTRFFKLRGPSSMLLGENSAAYGFDLLQDDKADVMICGGFDELRDSTFFNYVLSDKVLSPKNEKGEYVSLKEKLGTPEEEGKLILGEGSAFVVMEKLEHALERNAPIYAEVLGYSTGCDGIGNHLLTERSHTDLASVMLDSIQHTGISENDVDLVVGGSCLPWQVKSYEAKAIENVCKKEEVYYTTIKSKTGETLGASATLSLATGALGVKYEMVPGTGFPNQVLEGVNKQIIIPEESVEVKDKINYAIVNSIHLGGNTTSMVLKKY